MKIMKKKFKDIIEKLYYKNDIYLFINLLIN